MERVTSQENDGMSASFSMTVSLGGCKSCSSGSEMTITFSMLTGCVNFLPELM